MPATLSLLKGIEGKKLLDLGCGPGIYAKLLKNRGVEVYGIDLSEKMIKIAKSNVKNVDFRVGSVYKLPYKSNYFDIVLATYVVEYFEDIDRAFKEIKRVLKKNGIFIFSITNPVRQATYHIKRKPHTWRVFDNYFKEGKRTATWWWRLKYPTKVSFIHRTYETYIKAILGNGFVIKDYIDAKPPLGSKKVDRRSYEYASKVPQVCVFKVRK
jgi:ubiquinone/menaquinone biosynthesis C-methylase UbiE